MKSDYINNPIESHGTGRSSEACLPVAMRVRRDLVFISSVLFSLSLVAPIPHNLRYASTWHQRFFPADHMENQFAPIGFASLAIVLIGLIVIWAGYANRVRWTWFAMFVVVWGFAFPVCILPVLLDVHVGAVDWSVLWEATKAPGPARAVVKGPLDFLLMLFALLLPARAFFRKGCLSKQS